MITSAVTGEGLDALRDAIRGPLRLDWIEVAGLVPIAEGALLAKLRRSVEILEEGPAEDGTHLRFRLPESEWGRLRARWGDRAPDLF